MRNPWPRVSGWRAERGLRTASVASSFLLVARGGLPLSALDVAFRLRLIDFQCAHEAHIGIGVSVPNSVPKRGPRNIERDLEPCLGKGDLSC